MTRKFIADLHTHSRASDGDLTPTEVVQEAHKLGLDAIALTDHENRNPRLKANDVCLPNPRAVQYAGAHVQDNTLRDHPSRAPRNRVEAVGRFL